MGRAAAGSAEVLLPPPFRRTVRRSRRGERDRGRSEAVGAKESGTAFRAADLSSVRRGACRSVLRPPRTAFPRAEPSPDALPGLFAARKEAGISRRPFGRDALRKGRRLRRFSADPCSRKGNSSGEGKQRGGKALNEGRIRPEGLGPVIKEHDEKERRSALSARQTGGFSCPVRKERGGNRRAARLGQQGRRPHHRHPLLVCGAVQTAGRRRPYIGSLKASILIASGECPCVLSY